MRFIIKFLLINIILIFFTLLRAQDQENGERYEFKFNQKDMRLALNEISKKTGINFIYKDNLVSNRRITGNYSNTKKENLIKNILINYDIDYKIYGKNDYVLFKKSREKEIVREETVVEEITAEFSNEIHTVTVPKLISESDPFYPPEAVQKNIEGEVTIRMFVNRQGKVTSVSVEKSSGSPILDSAALAYSNNLEFIPAQANGHPLNTWSLMVFKYNILGE